jgi:hypothetical protein
MHSKKTKTTTPATQRRCFYSNRQQNSISQATLDGHVTLNLDADWWLLQIGRCVEQAVTDDCRLVDGRNF